MDEGDLEAEQAWTRRVVDEVRAGVDELCEGGPDVVHLVGDVMHSRPSFREETPDRRLGSQRLEQLDPAVADPNRGGTNSLVGDGRTVFDLSTEELRVGRERRIEIVDRNTEVVDAVGLHAGEATERAC